MRTRSARRRRGSVALAVLAALAAVSGPAAVRAGPATTQANGNFLMIDMDVTPPRANSGATLRYHAFFGNRKGAVSPREARSEIRLHRGFRLRGPVFPRCPLPRDPSEVGKSRCPRRARVGQGTFEADARPLLAGPVSGSFRIYNGQLRRGRPTLILLARAEVGGATVRSEVDYRYGGSTLRSLPPPAGAPTGLFSLTKVSLRIGAKRRGRSYVATPRRCRGSWRFRETSFFEGGGSISARDTVSCVRR